MAFLLWLLSIFVGIGCSVGIGFLIYWISNSILKIKYTDRSNIPLWSAIAMGCFCFFAIFASTMEGCTSNHNTFDGTLISFISPFFIVFLIIMAISLFLLFIQSQINKSKYEKEQKDQEIIVEKEMKIKAEMMKKESEWRSEINKYGGELNTIICEDNSENPIIISVCHNMIIISSNYFNQAHIILEKFHFEDLIDFTTFQESDTTPLKANTTTTTTTGNMLKRGLIGGVALGALGAGVGAITANKNSTTEYSGGETIQNYSISLIFNSLTKPSFLINFNDNKKEYTKAIGIFTYIINNKMNHSNLTIP